MRELSLFTGIGGGLGALVRAVSVVTLRCVAIMAQDSEVIFGVIVLLEPEINALESVGSEFTPVGSTVIVYMVNGKEFRSSLATTFTLATIGSNSIPAQSCLVAFSWFSHFLRRHLITLANLGVDTILVLLPPFTLIYSVTFLAVRIEIFGSRRSFKFSDWEFPFTHRASLCV